MNRDELLKILQEETDGFIEQSRLRDDVLDALEKVQEIAINYNHSCKSDSELLVCDCKDEHWVYDESGVDMYCKKCDINNTN